MPQNIRPGGMGPEHSMRSSSEDEEAIRRGKKRKRDERDESEGDRDRPGQSTKSRGPLREITNESRTVPSESPPVSEKPGLYGLERAFRDNLPDKLTEDRHLNGQQQEEAFKVIQRTMQLIRSYEHQGKDSTELRKAGRELDGYLQTALQGQRVPIDRYNEAYNALNEKVTEALGPDKSVSGFNETGTPTSKHGLTNHPSDSGVFMNPGKLNGPVEGQKKTDKGPDDLKAKLTRDMVNNMVKDLEELHKKSNAENAKLAHDMRNSIHKAKDSKPKPSEKQKKDGLGLMKLMNQLLGVVVDEESGETALGKQDLEDLAVPIRNLYGQLEDPNADPNELDKANSDLASKLEAKGTSKGSKGSSILEGLKALQKSPDQKQQKR